MGRQRAITTIDYPEDKCAALAGCGEAYDFRICSGHLAKRAELIIEPSRIIWPIEGCREYLIAGSKRVIRLPNIGHLEAFVQDDTTKQPYMPKVVCMDVDNLMSLVQFCKRRNNLIQMWQRPNFKEVVELDDDLGELCKGALFYASENIPFITLYVHVEYEIVTRRMAVLIQNMRHGLKDAVGRVGRGNPEF